jgi:GNAT superfamily N-acetyltransferase
MKMGLTYPSAVSRQLANAREFWLGYGVKESRRGNQFLYRSGVSDAQLNGVLAYSGHNLSSALQEAEVTFSGLPWLWWVGPDSRPGVSDDLRAHGFTEVGSMPVMCIHLDQVRTSSPPAGLQVRVVETASELAEWVRCYTWAFGIDTDQITDIQKVESARPDGAETLTRIAGWLDGRLVGTAALYTNYGVAGIYVVSTLKEFRGRGIGTELTAAALKAGRERGLSTGTLQASGLGLPIYRRMGFEEVSRYRLFAKR